MERSCRNCRFSTHAGTFNIYLKCTIVKSPAYEKMGEGECTLTGTPGDSDARCLRLAAECNYYEAEVLTR